MMQEHTYKKKKTYSQGSKEVYRANMFFKRKIIAKRESEQQGMKQIAQFEEKQVVKMKFSPDYVWF